MNVKPLLKYFPEIHHLPKEAQLRLLQSAHDVVFSPENKLRIWRKNLMGFVLLIALCAVVTSVLGPLLNLAASTTGIILMVIVFPLFLLWQQHRYVTQLRPHVQQLLQQTHAAQA